MIRKSKARRKADEKERFESFIEDYSQTYGLAGSIHFLSIFKEPWYTALYYKFKDITRLNLYRYGNTDHLGSHTKISVTKKQLFHLNLKGYIDSKNPHLAVLGIAYIAEQRLTASDNNAILRKSQEEI